MNSECEEIKKLFNELSEQPKQSFPKYHQPMDSSTKHGVYIIRNEESVLHVGRSLRGRNGIRQRLTDHLHDSSSFTKAYLKGRGATLRKDGYTYQYLVLENPRRRALLEAYATGTMCPKHIGLGV